MSNTSHNHPNSTRPELRVVDGVDMSKMRSAANSWSARFWGTSIGNTLVPDPHTLENRARHFLKIVKFAPVDPMIPSNVQPMSGSVVVIQGKKLGARKCRVDKNGDNPTYMEIFDSSMETYITILESLATEGKPVGLAALELEEQLPYVYDEESLTGRDQANIALGRTTLQLVMLSFESDQTMQQLSEIYVGNLRQE